MKRRLSVAGAATIRKVHLSAIGIALDAQDQQRIVDAEWKISTVDVARMTGIPEYLVRRIGRDDFHRIEVPGRVIGYAAGEFYVADDETTAKRRAIRDWNASHCPPLGPFLAAALEQAGSKGA